MYAVVRSYSGQGASELFDQLEQRNEEVKDLIGGVPGSSATQLVGAARVASLSRSARTRPGQTSPLGVPPNGSRRTSARRPNPPVITEGSTVVHFNS
jgi:hypothetical protein